MTVPAPLNPQRKILARLIFLGAVVASLSSLSSAQLLDNETGNFSANDGAYQLSWAVDEPANMIEFALRVQATGWVSAAFTNSASGHSGTDSIVVWVIPGETPPFTVIDGLSNSRSQPVEDVDSMDYVVTSAEEVEGVTTVFFNRPLAIDDINNVDILDADMTLAWAYSDNDGDSALRTFAQHPAANRGTQTGINFLEVANAIDPPLPTDAAGATTPPTDAVMVVDGIDALVNPTGQFVADNGRYSLTWRVERGSITFQMTANTMGWVGVGISMNPSGHLMTDSIVGWVSDDDARQLTLIDGFSNSQSQPQTDGQQDVVVDEAIGVQDDIRGRTTIQFSRPLLTGDGQDVDISNLDVSVSWAWGTNDGQADGSYAQHASRGRLDPMNLLDGALVPTGTLTADDGNWVLRYFVDVAADTIDLEVSVNTGGWIAMGLSNSGLGHDQTDSFVAWVDDDTGVVRALDQYSIAQGQPPLDIALLTSNDVTVLSGFQVSNVTTVTVRRPLLARDQLNDVDIMDMIQTIAWAYGSIDPTFDEAGLPIYPQHTRRGVLNENLLANIQPLVAGNFISPNGDYRLAWTASISDLTITFEMEADTTGWIGVGWSNSGSGHSNTDSVVAWVPEDINEPVRITDQYSNEQSRPSDDAVNNARLTSARQRDGVTTIRFTRPLLVGGSFYDQPIIPGVEMTVAWSYGADDGEIVDLTRPIYAQHSARGSEQIDLLGAVGIEAIVGVEIEPVVEDLAAGTFTSPNGVYRLTWAVSGDSIRFDVEADVVGWIGVGWSMANGGHSMTDSIVGWVTNDGETTVLTDGFSNARSTPLIDDQSDVTLIDSSEQNGVTSLSFSRPLQTGDGGVADVDIIDGNLFLSWAYGNNDGIAPNQYPQHNVRGTTQVNFLAGGDVVNGYGFINNAGRGLTATVVIVLGFFALIHLFHWARKGCAERRRRKAFQKFGGGFSDIGDPILGDNELPRSPPVPVSGGNSSAATGINKDNGGAFGAGGAQYNKFKTPPSAESVPQNSATPNTDGSNAPFQFQQKLYDVSGGDSTGHPGEFSPSNVVPNGSFLQGSQAVPYRQNELGPVQVTVVSPKPTSGSLTNASKRLLRTRVPFTQVKLKDAIIFAIYIFANVGWAYIWDAPGWRPEISLGFLASANALWVAVPATRNSASSWLLGIPFDRAIMFHRWIGQLLFVVATGHGLYFVIPGIDGGLDNTKNMTGFIAWALLLFIMLTALEPIRRHLFNVFFYSHAAFVAFYVFVWMHSVPSRPFIWGAIGVYAADRLLRMFKGGVLPQRALEAEALPGGMLRLRFRKTRFAKYRAGQYVFLNFPSVALLEWHPFSLSSGPHQDYLEVHVKTLGNHTRKLHQVVNGSLGVSPPLLRIDGPYGHLSMRYKRYSQLVLIGGGVGVTPLVSILKDIYQLDMSPEAKARHPRSAWMKHVYLVWAVPTETEWAWFADTITRAQALAALGAAKGAEIANKSDTNYPQITVFAHVTQQGSTSDESLTCGRPNLDEVFARVQDDGEQLSTGAQGLAAALPGGSGSARIAVYACGPKPMVNQAWDKARTYTRQRTRFDFHHEVFEF